MTQPKSDSATSATNRTLSVASLRAIFPSGGPPGERREMGAPLLEVRVLVERGTRGRKEHRVAGPRELGGPRDRALHRAAALDRRRPGERSLDRGSRLADREDDPGRAGDGPRQLREISVLVATPQDQEDALRPPSLERLRRRGDVRPLRIVHPRDPGALRDLLGPVRETAEARQALLDRGGRRRETLRRDRKSVV